MTRTPEPVRQAANVWLDALNAIPDERTAENAEQTRAEVRIAGERCWEVGAVQLDVQVVNAP